MHDRQCQPSLVVLDDLFPNRMSGFRLAEYTYLLRHVPAAEVWSGGEAGWRVAEGSFDAELEAFRASHPALTDRVIRLKDAMSSGRRGRLAYTIFLNQVYRFLPFLEARGLPFAFTLYPGGGLQLGVEHSDRLLQEVCESRLFRRMIVTQRLTLDYVLNRGICPAEKIALVPGCVAVDREGLSLPNRPVVGRDKEWIDLCFAAHRYDRSGRNKGYGMFLEIAKLLAGRFPMVRFHVVGGFTEDDIPLAELSGRIVFHGAMAVQELARFFTGMDGVVSPNVPFETQMGAFDGFPTGSCSEAALSGCAVFASDPLNQNESFVNGESLVIIPNHAPAAAYIIGEWLRRPEQLAALGRRGREAFAAYYDPRAQLVPRVRVLEECLAEAPAHPRQRSDEPPAASAVDASVKASPASFVTTARSGNTRPKLSVLVISFNQEATIRQTVESVLAQEVPFAMEILCADDASTDGTPRVLRDIAAAAGGRLTVIERPTRLGAVGNFLATYRQCRGDYVALLEGDDYWIDPEKLQKQVAHLESHPESSLCFHPVRFLNAEGYYESKAPRFPDRHPRSTADLLDNHLISTCSIVCRNERFGDLDEWSHGLPGIDWVFVVRHALCGTISILDETMAVYRCQGGISSSLGREGSFRSAITILTRLRSLLDPVHHEVIDAAITRRERGLRAMTSAAVPSHASPTRISSHASEVGWRRWLRPLKDFQMIDEPVSAATFDEEAYLIANPDVARAVEAGNMASGRQHFDLYGRHESPPRMMRKATLWRRFRSAVRFRR